MASKSEFAAHEGHTEHRPGYDAVADLRPLAFDAVNLVNATVVACLWLAGMWHDQTSQWYYHCVVLVHKILALHLTTALLFQLLARLTGKLIQTSHKAPREAVREELLQTLIGFAMVVAPLQAWASTNATLGRPTAYMYDVAECVPMFARAWPAWQQKALYALSLLVGAVLADAYNYWKHR